MKKIVAIAALAATLVGCKVDGDLYNKEATKEQLMQECKRFGGELNTYRYGATGVDKHPWQGNCIHPGTGNQFPVYVKGVLE